MGRVRWILVATAVMSVFVAPGSSARTAATLPAGFSETIVAGGLASPTAMAFAPDGRIFVGEQSGTLRVIKNGALLPTPFLSLTVSSSGERGLLGVAFDPDFALNHFVYVYYTATSPAIHNRVSRFTANGDVAVAGSEFPILDLSNLSATNHNGGAIHFGPDGKLYVAVGENAVPSNAQSMSTPLGKMLRINADGSSCSGPDPTACIPSNNPFYATASGVNKAIWAVGLRNPYTFAFQPGTGRMFINDVGENAYEEINEGIAGSNYGWPNSEGPTSTPGERAPLYWYGHGSGGFLGCAITGGAFYNPPVVQFPAAYVGSYFFADFCGGWINRVDPANDYAVSSFATAVSAPVDLHVAVDGGLYYLARGGGSSTGIVGRIQYTASSAPAITTTALPDGTTTLAYNQTVTATGGTAPNTWTVDSGTLPPGLTITAGSPNAAISGTPTTSGAYMFTLKVTDAAGQADTQQFTLDVRAPLVVVSASLVGGTVGAPYGPVSLTAAGGKTPYGWALAAGSGPLPPGLTLAANGAISGTPTNAGTYTFTARASDSGSPARADTEPFSITVTPSSALIISTTNPLPAGKVNQPYSVQFTATGGTGPLTWSQTSGTRPSGLNLNPTSGLLSGTPTKAGKYTFTVRATDSAAHAVSKPFTLKISKK